MEYLRRVQHRKLPLVMKQLLDIILFHPDPPKKIAVDAGLSYSSLNKMLNGMHLPNLANLLRVTDYLGYEIVLRKKKNEPASRKV